MEVPSGIDSALEWSNTVYEEKVEVMNGRVYDFLMENGENVSDETLEKLHEAEVAIAELVQEKYMEAATRN
jgi:hypothetical protein